MSRRFYVKAALGRFYYVFAGYRPPKGSSVPCDFLYNEKENNDMKVIGFRKSSFKGDDGQEVSGVNLFLTEKCEKGEGLSCDRIYVMDRILAASGYTPKLGDEVIIEWNRWGKCSGIRLAKF